MTQHQSPFFDLWADEKERERFKLHNRELFERFKHEADRCHKGHMDYAKWMLASLIAVHGGAIYAISGLRTAVPAAESHFLITAAAFNLAGVFLTLIAGLLAWINLQLGELVNGEWANPAMLYRSDIPRKGNDWIDRTMYASATIGSLSGIAFAVSASLIVIGLYNLPVAPAAPGSLYLMARDYFFKLF